VRFGPFGTTLAAYVAECEAREPGFAARVEALMRDATWYNFPNGIRETGACCNTPGMSHQEVGPMTAYDSTTLARFWAKVDKGDGCWLWTASTIVGYGQFWPKSRTFVYAHRFAYELAYGPIPAGLQICHTCDNRRCVNPAHMFLGTHKDNAEDRERKGRSPRGVARPNAKLNDATVRAIRAAANASSIAALARSYGVSECTISDVIKQRTWRHV
jgi:hypothetical protein